MGYLERFTQYVLDTGTARFTYVKEDDVLLAEYHETMPGSHYESRSIAEQLIRTSVMEAPHH